MTISLPDVNVWLALVGEGHIHHLIARDWFSAQPDASVALCRVTQMALLRLLTNHHVMGRSPRTITEAWEIYFKLRRNRCIVFATDGERVDALWNRWMTQPGIGPSSWTELIWPPLLKRIPIHWSLSILGLSGGLILA